MEYVQATYLVRYKVFTPGEVVRPTYRRCPLDEGEYVVSRYVPPLSPGDDPIVFVEGRRTGVEAEYLTSVSHPCEHPDVPWMERVGEPVVIAGPNAAPARQPAGEQPTCGTGPRTGYVPTRGRSGRGLTPPLGG